MSNALNALSEIIFSGEDVGSSSLPNLLQLANYITNQNVMYYFNNKSMESIHLYMNDFVNDFIYSANLLDEDLDESRVDVARLCDWLSLDTNPTLLLFGVFDLCFLAFTNDFEAVEEYPNINKRKIYEDIKCVPFQMSLPYTIKSLYDSIKSYGCHQISNSIFATMDEYTLMILNRLCNNLKTIRTVVRNKHSISSDYEYVRLCGFLRLLLSIENIIKRRK